MRLYPHALSGGMARRTLLASVLISDAEYIIADEPTPGLTLELAIEALQRLRELASQGKGVLLITHDIDLAMAIADRMLVMNEGRVVDTLEKEDWQCHPIKTSDSYTQELFASLPQFDFYGSEHITTQMGSELFTMPEFTYRYESGKTIRCKEPITIRQGEAVSLVGPSGSGKSTIGRVMAGLLPQKDVKMYWKGKQMQTQYGKSQHVFSSAVLNANPIQLVYQQAEHAFHPKVRMGQVLQHHKDVIDSSIWHALGIEEGWLDRWPHELSGGQLQRLNILRALLPTTELLIADEMTASLDPMAQAQIWKAIEIWRQKNQAALLLITHNQALADRLTARTMIMDEESS